MSGNRNSADLWERAYGVLLGARERDEAPQGVSEDPFACLFLQLVKISGGAVVPIDDFRLNGKDDVGYLAETEHVYASYQSLGADWYREDLGPFIGFRGEKEEPVLLHRRRGRYVFRTGTSGREETVTRERAGEFAGRGLFVVPVDSGRRTSPLLMMGRELLLRRRVLLQFAMLTVASSVLTMAIPNVINAMATNVMAVENVKMIVMISLSLLLTIFANVFIQLGIHYTAAGLQSFVCARIYVMLLHRMMQMKTAEEHRLADKLDTMLMPFLGAVESIIAMLFSAIVYLAQVVIVLSVFSAYLSELARPLMALFAAEVSAALAAEGLILKKTKEMGQRQEEYVVRRGEIIDNIEAIKNNHIEDRMFYRFAGSFGRYADQRAQVSRYRQWIGLLGSMVSGIGVLLIFMSAAADGRESTGAVTATVSLFTLLAGYLGSFINAVSEIIGSYPYLQYISWIQNAETESVESQEMQTQISGRIELRDVSFCYPGSSSPVLNKISLTVQPGEYLGVVGASGCGKSTLVRLLLGFERATAGTIEYDGVDIGQYDLHRLRRQFGVVLQNAGCMNGSVRHNIGMSDDADMEKVRRAAKLAAIDADIEAMPMKYNTFLSGETDVISGGQGQRVALARALMNEPRILILDEATSAVDNITQEAIRCNLDALNITRIVVAHRLSTVRRCDRIIVLGNGEIQEQGSYEELMARNGLFAHMAKRNL